MILPISPNYVKNWGLWESVREFLQNAYDQKDRTGCELKVSHANGVLNISTSEGSLDPSTLILGCSDKEDGERGRFGEGYKLALLVLARQARYHGIYQSGRSWYARIIKSNEFRSEVLEIVETVGSTRSGVIIEIGMSEEEWTALRVNICSIKNIDYILPESAEEGRIYVGGLFVKHVKGFKKGYNFSPGTIKLNRDRDMVSDFDLAWATSALWTRQTGDELYDLIKAKAPDVQYVEYHPKESVTTYVAASYVKEHGTAVPVSDQREIEEATQAGAKWVLVPEVLKKLVRSVVNYALPKRKSPAEKLRQILKDHNVQGPMLREFEEVIEELEHV